MGTRNLVWARKLRRRIGGPLEKLLFLHICDAIPEHGPDPHLETSLGFLAAYAEVDLVEAERALVKLNLHGLVQVEDHGDRLLLRIPFPT